MDAALAKLVTSLRKATAEQVRQALEELEQRQAAGEKLDLADILIERGYLGTATAARLRTHAARRLGPTIPGYQIVEPLGGGGMGRVYAAKQIELDRLVALKVLVPDLMRDTEAKARFLREARAVGSLDHPNIVKAYDVSVGDPDAGIPPYIAMEFIRGETLHALLQRVTRLGERLTLKIASGVAAALDHAFRQGLVHRDIKPDNIMLTKQGEVKLCDLGLAKRVGQDQTLTHAGMTHGTPHFMSPEQAQGRRDLDIRSDLYSLGCTMFRTAVGRPPYVAETALELLMAHVDRMVPSAKALRPDLSIAFDRIVRKLMAKLPEERYQYPAHLLTDLELVLAGEAPRLQYGVPFRRASTAPAEATAAGTLAVTRGATAEALSAPVGATLPAEESQSAAAPEPLRFVDESSSESVAAVAGTAFELDSVDPDEWDSASDNMARGTGRRRRRGKKQKRDRPKPRGSSSGRHRKGPAQSIGVRVAMAATSARAWMRAHRWPLAYAAIFVLVAAVGFVASTALLRPASPPQNDDPIGSKPSGSSEDDVPTTGWREDAAQRRAMVEAALAAEAAAMQHAEQQATEVPSRFAEAVREPLPADTSR